MAAIVTELESLPPEDRDREVRRLIEEKRKQIADLEELLPVLPAKIVVNGSEHTVEQKEISYEDVAEIAYGPKARGWVLSMVCRGGGGQSRTLTPGESVRVEDKMVFSAYDTSNA